MIKKWIKALLNEVIEESLNNKIGCILKNQDIIVDNLVTILHKLDDSKFDEVIKLQENIEDNSKRLNSLFLELKGVVAMTRATLKSINKDNEPSGG